jgi:Ca-activated chloride channel family protein
MPMTFIWPGLLFGLLLVPVLAWLYLRRDAQRRTATDDLAAFGGDGGSRPGRGRRHLPPMFMMLGLGLLLFGMARPQMEVALPHTEGTVMLAFDVSNSMAADDVEPTRLQAAKQAARSLVEAQPSTVRLGVVAFGGSGLIVQAPTNDQAAVLDAIDRLEPQGGTSLGEAMFTSLNAIAGKALTVVQATGEDGASALRIDDYSSAVVLLFTDGENTEQPDPIEVANLAAQAGVRVYSIGVGTAEGATVEVDGFNLLSQLDEAALQKIADETNGEYYRLDDPESIDHIYDQVDLQLTSRGEHMEITSIVAGISAILILIGALLSMLWFGRVP